MKRTLYLATLVAAILAGVLLYNSHLDAEADYARRLDQAVQNAKQDNRDADKQLHEATCKLHKGDRAALKLHGCEVR